MFDFIGVAVVVAVALFGYWLATRSSRVRNPFLKWIALAPSLFLASVGVVLFVLALVGYWRINRPGARPSPSAAKVEITPARVARGQQMSAVCGGCHSTKLGGPLVGRNFFEGGDGPPVGTIYAANLTAAGEIRTWTDGELIRAIREGVHKSGRSLAIMPSKAFHNMSDEDVQSIVAFLRSQPPQGQSSPPTKLNVVGALFFGLGVAETSAQPAITHPVIAPAPGPTAEYGKYLVAIAICADCHGVDLGGRVPRLPGPPRAPNIKAIVAAWSEDGFVRTFRTGVDPANHTVLPQMPWRSISNFASDDDLKAMYAYLRTLSPQ
ncbi:MAG TPA: cytochrome c [Gemmatimonadaceae bacterium]|nr:cytochrome c [Gemmatimonadaceae bacterium]